MHNAGILGHRVALEQYDVQTWDEVMNVNLRAPFLLIQFLLPLLKQVARSCVNVSNTTKPEPIQSWSALALIDCLTTLNGLVALLPREVVAKELFEVWMSFTALIKLVLFTMKT